VTTNCGCGGDYPGSGGGCGGGCSGGCAGVCSGGGSGGCCAGTTAITPVSVANRPSLGALRYRVGTHPQFLATMRAELSSQTRPALTGLRARAADDLTLGLLDGWATVADVLTFYTERIAQEGYLRTATERWSVVELARLVGYRPRPGLSATAYLSYGFTGDHELTILPGAKAQSVPGPGEQPATFETADPLVARSAHTALPLRHKRPQRLSSATFASRDKLTVAGALGDIRRGDVLVVTFPKVKPNPDAWAVLEVNAVEVDTAALKTTLTVTIRHTLNLADTVVPAPHKLVRQLAPGETRLGALVKALRVPPSVPPVSERELHRDVGNLFAAGSTGVSQLLSVAVPEIAPLLWRAEAATVAPDAAPPTISRMKVQAAMFGHQAQLYPTYSDGEITGYVDPMVTPLPVAPRSDEVVVIGVVADPPPTIDPPKYHPSTELDLDTVYPAVQPDSILVLVNPGLTETVEFRTVNKVEVVTTRAVGMTGRVTRVTFDDAWPSVAAGAEHPQLSTVLRGTTVLAQNDPLTPATESMDDEDVSGTTLELDGLFPYLVPGRWVVVAGERTDAAIRDLQRDEAQNDATAGTGVPGAELSMIASVEQRVAQLLGDDGKTMIDLPGDAVHTFVHLAAPLAYTYRRPSTVVHGNVVRATHGETRKEVLGSGDATRPFAAYPLKQPPLTYLPVPTAVGAESTLTVFVDGVRWNEATELITAGPADRKYLITVDEQGVTNVVFGDGVHGARTPTGPQNIEAAYRSGIGVGGNVGADRITLPTSRPLGVTGVTNPVPATGGADPESRDAIRRNAALSIQSLDRLVSVSDYQDYSAAFAGIGSASARELSDGRRQLVHVTIAGINDEPIAANSDLARNLRQALLDLGDPYEDVRVATRLLRLLVVSAKVRIAADRRWADVEAAVRAALLAAFGPSARLIGEPVTSSSLLAVMAAVPGVEYVDLDVFDSLDENDLVGTNPAAGLGLRPVVQVRLAEADPTVAGGIRAAELVLLSRSAHDTLILSELT